MIIREDGVDVLWPKPKVALVLPKTGDTQSVAESVSGEVATPAEIRARNRLLKGKEYK